MKKRYLIISIILVLSVFFGGCGDKEKEDINQLFKQGEQALEEGKYKEASDYLSQYLNQEPKDEVARSMYKQALNINKAINYKEKGFYDDALECLDMIVNIDSGSQTAKVEAEKLKDEVENLKEEYEKDIALKKEDAKIIAKNSVRESEANYDWEQSQNKDNGLLDDLENSDDSKGGELINAIKDKIEELLTR